MTALVRGQTSVMVPACRVVVEMEQAIRRGARWCVRPPAVVAIWVIVPGPVAVKVVMMAVGVVRLEPRRSTGVGAADVAAAVVGVAEYAAAVAFDDRDDLGSSRAARVCRSAVALSR